MNQLQLTIQRFGWISSAVGTLSVILYIVGIFFNPSQFFRSYLVGYLFWLEVALGCFGILMISHLTGGHWGASIRRILEAGGRTLGLMTLLFIPILFGLPHIFEWANPEIAANSSLLEHQHIYLNPIFFTARGVIYFTIWVGIMHLLSRWSAEQDHKIDKRTQGKIRSKFRSWSAVGLVIYCLTSAFAAVDWIMSLEHHWYSTIYGMLFFVSHGLSAMAFVVILVSILSRFEPLSKVYHQQCLIDLGNILLVFIILWAYLNYSQLVIQWEGNKPDEVTWYIRRTREGWQWLAYGLIIFQFFVPFFILLFRSAKRNTIYIGVVAGITFLVRLMDIYWNVIPGFKEHAQFHWMDLISPLSIGGIWILAFTKFLSGRPILPQHESELKIGEAS